MLITKDSKSFKKRVANHVNTSFSLAYSNFTVLMSIESISKVNEGLPPKIRKKDNPFQAAQPNTYGRKDTLLQGNGIHITGNSDHLLESNLPQNYGQQQVWCYLNGTLA